MLWLVLFPVFQTPDENRHYDYVLHLAKAKHFPKVDNYVGRRDHTMAETEYLSKLVDFERLRFHWDQKTTFVLGADSLWQKVRTYKKTFAATDIPDSQNIDLYAHPPLYYLLCAGVYNLAAGLGFNILLRFYIIRFLSVILIYSVILLSLKTLKIIRMPVIVRISVLTLLVFWSQLSMFAVSVQPDVLATLFVTLCIYLFVRSSSGKAKHSFYILAGLVLGGLGLIKIHYFAAVFLSVPFVWIVYNKIVNLKWDYKILLTISIALLISGTWFGHNLCYYHAVHPGETLLPGGGDTIFQRFISVALVVKKYVFRSYIAHFGWLDTLVPRYIYRILGMGILVGIGSAIYLFAKNFYSWIIGVRKNGSKGFANIVQQNAAGFYLILPLVCFIGLMVYIGIAYSSLVNNQGRLYFPFILTEFYILTHYPSLIIKKEWVGNIYVFLLCGLVIVAHVHSIVVIWHRYYGI